MESTKVGSFITHRLNLFVDETVSVAKASRIAKLQRYYGGETEIRNAYFPAEGKVKKIKKQVVIFHFNKEMSSNEIISEMEKDGYVPGTIRDLLSLSAAEPELQKKFPIIALASCRSLVTSDQYKYLVVPRISVYGTKRDLDLVVYASAWSAENHFIAVRK
jgi:hypothetical protein